MISHTEAQELHEAIGAAIEDDATGLPRAREIAALLVSDTDHPPDIQRVEFNWSTAKGACIECGLPAAYSAPDMYGEGRREIGEADTLKCSVCAAFGAAIDGERIVYLYADNYADMCGVKREETAS